MITYREMTDRNEFVKFIDGLTDKSDIAFAKTYCLGFHDRFYTFEKTPPVVMENDGVIVCVLFVNYTKQDKYVSIINIMTPTEQKGHGYARQLMHYAVQLGVREKGCTRIRFNADVAALPFYNKLNCMYFGRTRGGDFYVNLPLTDEIVNAAKLDFKPLWTVDVKDLMTEPAVRLTTRRIEPIESMAVYKKNLASFVPVDSYRHYEFKKAYLDA